MKNKIRAYLPITVLMSVIFSIFYSCEEKQEETVPILTTAEVTDITQIAAVSGGIIISEGSSTILTRGVCWSTNPTTSISDNKTSDGAGAGSFTSSITGLTPNTTYFVRSYASNSYGTGYGDAMSFTTQEPTVPILTTSPVTDISFTQAICGGTVTSWDYAPATTRGVCWGTTSNPTIDNSKTIDGEGDGSFTSSMTDLLDATTYFVRAYATNIVGTGYGNTISFKTDNHRDKFIGEWMVYETCTRSNYSVAIQADFTNTAQVLLYNFGNPGSGYDPAVGLVSTDSIFVTSQTIGEGWTVSGKGIYQPDGTISWDYTLWIAFEEYNCVATFSR